jgi:hypothetical protein
MPYPILIHFMGEDPMVAEVDEMPDPSDQFLACKNPRRRDGKDVSYLLQDIRTLLLPWHRIHCVEILSTGEEEEEVITFVRE